MDYQNFWKKFEQTGLVEDYLHYTACVRDELASACTDDLCFSDSFSMFHKMENEDLRNSVSKEESRKEGEIKREFEYNHDWNGTLCHADWGI